MKKIVLATLVIVAITATAHAGSIASALGATAITDSIGENTVKGMDSFKDHTRVENTNSELNTKINGNITSRGDNNRVIINGVRFSNGSVTGKSTLKSTLKINGNVENRGSNTDIQVGGQLID